MAVPRLSPRRVGGCGGPPEVAANSPVRKEIELLVEESWRLVAPKKLLTAYDAE